MEDVITTWNGAFAPIRSEVESISFISRGKAVQQPMSAGNGLPQSPAQTPINGPRRTASGLIPARPQARTLRTPSMPLEGRTSPAPSYKPPSHANATDFTTATILGGSAVNRSTPNGLSAQHDYFGAAHSPAPSRSPVSPMPNGGGGINGLAKKKPPPPPPPKRITTPKPAEWVVALYAFAGQGSGDLSFREGDKIKVVKRTGTDQDWYVIPFVYITRDTYRPYLRWYIMREYELTCMEN